MSFTGTPSGRREEVFAFCKKEGFEFFHSPEHAFTSGAIYCLKAEIFWVSPHGKVYHFWCWKDMAFRYCISQISFQKRPKPWCQRIKVLFSPYCKAPLSNWELADEVQVCLPFAQIIISKTLSQIIQIQSNLQKSIAVEMQTNCSYIKNKMSISFFWVLKISRIEVAQPIFFTCNLFNYFFHEFICFYCQFKACIFKTKLAPGIFIWWYNVDTIQIYDRPKQILTISTILQRCESWKKTENQ